MYELNIRDGDRVERSFDIRHTLPCVHFLCEFEPKELSILPVTLLESSEVR